MCSPIAFVRSICFKFLKLVFILSWWLVSFFSFRSKGLGYVYAGRTSISWAGDSLFHYAVWLNSLYCLLWGIIHCFLGAQCILCQKTWLRLGMEGSSAEYLFVVCRSKGVLNNLRRESLLVPLQSKVTLRRMQTCKELISLMLRLIRWLMESLSPSLLYRSRRPDIKTTGGRGGTKTPKKRKEEREEG